MTARDHRRGSPRLPDGVGSLAASFDGGEILFERRRVGAWLRIAAVDPRTGEEAVAMGPAEAWATVERLAAAKLARRIGRR